MGKRGQESPLNALVSLKALTNGKWTSAPMSWSESSSLVEPAIAGTDFPE